MQDTSLAGRNGTLDCLSRSVMFRKGLEDFVHLGSKGGNSKLEDLTIKFAFYRYSLKKVGAFSALSVRAAARAF